jgi:hypothetical protein
VQNVHGVLLVMSGALGVASAFVTLIATCISASAGRRPLLPPAQPGQPRPRLFSPKAILKGWTTFLVLFVALWFVTGVILGATGWYKSDIANQTTDGERRSDSSDVAVDQGADRAWNASGENEEDPTNGATSDVIGSDQAEPAAVPLNAADRKEFEAFVFSKRGIVLALVIVGLCAAAGANRAGKQAKAFRLSHAFLSIGSFYLIGGLLTYHYYGASIAALQKQYDLSLANWEPVATCIGMVFGGIMGSED